MGDGDRDRDRDRDKQRKIEKEGKRARESSVNSPVLVVCPISTIGLLLMTDVQTSCHIIIIIIINILIILITFNNIPFMFSLHSFS